MNAQEFQPLYDRFKTAVSWINEEYRRRDYDRRRILTDVKLQSDLKEFDTNVVDPMEAAWQKLPIQDREKFKCL